MLRGSGRVEGMLTRVFSVIVMCRMYVEAVSSAPGRRKRADMDLSVAFYGSFFFVRSLPMADVIRLTVTGKGCGSLREALRNGWLMLLYAFVV